MIAARHRHAHAEKDDAEAGLLHAIDEVLKLLERQSGIDQAVRPDRLALDDRPQGREHLEVLARANLQEQVGGLGAGRLADVHEDHGAVLAAIGHESSLLREGVFREMAWMALGGVAAPVDHEIGAVLDFAERTGHLAAQLGGDLGWAVSERGMAVDHAADKLGERNGLALRLAGDIAEAIDQRHVRLVQIIGRRLDRVVHGRRPAVDERVGIEMLGRVVLEPRFAEAARSLGLGDALAVGMQLDVVAHASAKSTCGILDNGQAHEISVRVQKNQRCCDSPEPGGTRNVQPSSRPR
jgi:hypothetical protein